MTKNDSLKWVAASAIKHPFFMAQALAEFQFLHLYDEETLATFLECSLDDLTKLALCRKPSSENDIDIQKIARYVKCSHLALKQLLVEVDPKLKKK